MFKYETKEVVNTEDVIVAIECDRCHKDLGDNKNNFLGAYFIPSAS